MQVQHLDKIINRKTSRRLKGVLHKWRTAVNPAVYSTSPPFFEGKLSKVALNNLYHVQLKLKGSH